VVGGAGNNTLAVVMTTGNPIPGNGLSFNGVSGSDTLLVLGPNSSDRFVWRRRQLRINRSAIGLANVELFRLNGGRGNDTFDVASVTGMAIALVGGAGGADRLRLVGSAAGDVFNLSPGSVTGSGGSIGYTGLEAIGLEGHGGNDRFSSASVSLSPGLRVLRLLGHAGDDSFSFVPLVGTSIFIDGGTPTRPTFPGDRLNLGFAGVERETLRLTNGGTDGLNTFTNRASVQFVSIESGQGGFGSFDIRPLTGDLFLTFRRRRFGAGAAGGAAGPLVM
jgi:hypothetical protein